MISIIGNRPALQIGRYQVIDYDTEWLDDALRRAARAADHEDFPFVADIRSGIVKYLETKCPLKLLPLEDLFERMRKMLVKIGCERIAEKLEPLAPPEPKVDRYLTLPGLSALTRGYRPGHAPPPASIVQPLAVKIKAAMTGGATRLVLCDTNGGSLPDEVGAATRAAFDFLGLAPGGPVQLGIHTHNDSGLAIANAMAAVSGGSPPR